MPDASTHSSNRPQQEQISKNVEALTSHLNHIHLLRREQLVHQILHLQLGRSDHGIPRRQHLRRPYHLTLALTLTSLTETCADGSIQYSVPAAPPHPTLPACRPKSPLRARPFGWKMAIPVVQSASPASSVSAPVKPRIRLRMSAMGW